jgi:hypothetical protein
VHPDDFYSFLIPNVKIFIQILSVQTELIYS